MNAVRLVALALVAAAGCESHPPTPDITVLDAALEVLTEPGPPNGVGTPPSPPPPKGSHRRGLVGMIFHATHDLGLTVDQSHSVDRIEQRLQGSEAGVKVSLGAYESEL